MIAHLAIHTGNQSVQRTQHHARLGDTKDAEARTMMTHPIRYTCPRELFPCIEAALAANGYAVEAATRLGAGDDVLEVMQRGAAQVLLATYPGHPAAAIEVWGDAQTAAVDLLESLPYTLARQAQGS